MTNIIITFAIILGIGEDLQNMFGSGAGVGLGDMNIFGLGEENVSVDSPEPVSEIGVPGTKIPQLATAAPHGGKKGM